MPLPFAHRASFGRLKLRSADFATVGLSHRNVSFGGKSCFTLNRIADHKINRIDALLPWNFKG